MKNSIRTRMAMASPRRRRGGSVLVYVALMMPVLLGVAAMAVDMDYLYMRRAQCQRAADAAALAGAYCLAYTCSGSTNFQSNAKALAADNGYNSTTGTATFSDNSTCTTSTTCITPVTDATGTKHINWYKVTLSRPEATFFSGIWGWHGQTIQASAVAQFTSVQSVPIDQPDYGLGSSAIYNYSLFGPYASYSNGDYTATKYFDGTAGTVNGALNPNYRPQGINFIVNFPQGSTLTDYAKTYDTNSLNVQLFDPSTTDNGLDEIRSPGTTDSGYNNNEYTNTTFTLIYDKDGNPENPSASDHITVASQSYADDTSSAMKWVTPTGFTVDMSSSTYSAAGSAFHVNVVGDNGSSENGFSIRAGPPHATSYDYPTTGTPNTSKDTSAQVDALWKTNYNKSIDAGNTGNGTEVSADNVLPVNFNTNGTATIELGNITVPSLASGATNAGTITVQKFDTDVGAEGITYEMVKTGQDPTVSSNVIASYTTSYTYQGSSVSLNTGNGVFSYDNIVLPPTFTGGTLYVLYTAGGSDTSEWQMSYSGAANTQGGIRLVM